jgi:hypothetical protein
VVRCVIGLQGQEELSMRLSVLAQEIEVTERTIRSDKLFGIYDDLASSLLSDYDTTFGAANKDPKHSPKHLETDAWSKVTSAIETLLGECLKAGILDQDLNSLIRIYHERGGGNELATQLTAIHEAIGVIFVNEQELDEYRRARRQGRSKIIGGGFGVAGAVEGMALAGLANAATGIASGTFNLLAKAGSAVMARSKAQEVLGTAKSNLKAALHTAIQNLYDLHLIVLHQNDAENYDTQPARLERCRRAAVIFENLAKVALAPDQHDKVVLQCLSLDPRAARYYDQVLGRILAEKADSTDVAQLRDLARDCGLNFDAIAAQTFERFAGSHRSGSAFEEWAEVVNRAASTLQHDHVAYADRAVAERFLTEVVGAGLESFLQDHSLADRIIGPDAAHLPTTRPGIVAAVKNISTEAMPRFAKAFAEAALAGEVRCVDIAAADSVSFVLGFLNRSDTTTFGIGWGADAFQSAKDKLLKGKLEAAREQQVARALLTFSDYFFANPAETRQQIEEYFRQRRDAEKRAAERTELERTSLARNAAERPGSPAPAPADVRPRPPVTAPSPPDPTGTPGAAHETSVRATKKILLERRDAEKAAEKPRSPGPASADVRTSPTVAAPSRQDPTGTPGTAQGTRVPAAKKKWVACALALPLGVVGAHRLYLRSWLGAAFYLLPLPLIIVAAIAEGGAETPVVIGLMIWLLVLPLAALVDLLRLLLMPPKTFSERYPVGSNLAWRVWL